MNTIEEWKKEVTEYLETINIQLQKSEDSKNLYYGFEVIDGQLKMNPEILFIGINPGYGDKTRHYKIKIETDEISYLDHFEGNYPYPLAREIVRIFELMDINENKIVTKFKNDCVKTNLFHIMTYEEKDIKKCFKNSKLNHSDYWNKSVFYCLELIKLIKPRIVIFEGKSVYNEIIENIYEIENSWDEQLMYGYYFSEIDNIHFLGCQRNRSNILSKEIIAEKLKSIL